VPRVLLCDRPFFVTVKKFTFLCQQFDVIESRISANWLGALTNQLHSVVILWIVAGSNHYPSIGTEVRGSEIYFFRTTLTDVDDIDTTINQP
jgi:hypothetical protein